ncbi:unnamed protein product [Closterium sp. Naga37s-1]|nr:unnamed protein product [Closterium sp. Naga37s-1]
MSSAPYHPLASSSSRDSAPVNPPQPLVRELYGVGRGPGSGSARALASGPGSESASAQQPVGLATQGAHLAGGSPGLAARGIAGSAKTGSGTVSVADNGGDDVERWREAVQGLRDAESLVGALEQLLLGPDTLFLDANTMRSARSVYDGQRQLHALNRRVAGLQGELDAAVEAAREARAGRRESEEERRRMQDALAQAQRDMEATSVTPLPPPSPSPRLAGVFDLYTTAIDAPSPAPAALATGAARAARAGAVSAWVAGAAVSAGVASPHASVQSLLVEAGQQVAGEEEKTGGAVEALGGRQEEHGRELVNGKEEEGQEMGTVGVSGGSKRVVSQEEGTGTSNTEGDDDEFLDSLQ